MPNLADKKVCCGCQACVAACPVKAINVIQDENWFIYPAINKDKCINCGACEKVCPVITPKIKKEYTKVTTFSGYLNDAEKLRQSSSGGFATALSEYVLQNRGIVYGVKYNDDFSKAEYIRIDEIGQLNQVKGSKYIMSEIEPKVYKIIEKDLNNGLIVLFIGCPCEVYSLKNYLFNTNTENLITGEVICQGGTSARALHEFVNTNEEKYKSKIVSLNMRYKKDGQWLPYCINFQTASGITETQILANTDFNASFYNVKRLSCYNCLFKYPNGAADFTMGDHIGVNNQDDSYNEKGVSIVFINTKKGETIFSNLDMFKSFQETYEKGSGIQSCLTESFKRLPYSAEFEKIFHQDGLQAAAEYFEKSKIKTFEDLICNVRNLNGNNKNFKCIIWGVGRYFEITYETILNKIPNSVIVGIVDKYKDGYKHNIKINKISSLKEMDFDHIFITTISGKEEAMKTLKEFFGEEITKKITIAIPQ